MVCSNHHQIMKLRLFRPIIFALAGLAWATVVQAQQFGYAINYPDTNTVTIYGGDSPDVASGQTTLYIPDSIYVSERTNFLLVTSIGYQAFAGKNYTNLVSVRLPSGLKSLEFQAFCGLPKLTSIPLPSTLVRIGEQALRGCPLLTNFTIPGSVTSIEGGAFSSSGMTSMTIPASVTNLATGVFMYCPKLTNVVISGSLPVIPSWMFSECSSLRGFTIPSSTKAIGDSAFNMCYSLTGIVIPSGVTNIGASAFSQCTSLTSVTIPTAVTSIGGGAFAGCEKLTSIKLPGVTSIGDQAFGGTGLTNIFLQSSVTNIGWGAFGCPGLKAVYFLGNPPTIEATPFYSPSIIYYLPGTTGWGASFSDRPARLWNPQVRTYDANFGMRANRFGFTVTGTADIPITIEATSNLAPAAWVSLETCTLTNGSFYFSDPASVSYPRRTYRIRSP